nr:MAG TPA: hypothetical protein [Caudoviricetes sp.]
MPAICAGYPCGCVRIIRTNVRRHTRGYLSCPFVEYSGEKDKNGLNSDLYGLIGIRLPKRIINPKKRPKIKSYGRVRFLSVSQRV